MKRRNGDDGCQQRSIKAEDFQGVIQKGRRLPSWPQNSEQDQPRKQKNTDLDPENDIKHNHENIDFVESQNAIDLILNLNWNASKNEKKTPKIQNYLEVFYHSQIIHDFSIPEFV